MLSKSQSSNWSAVIGEDGMSEFIKYNLIAFKYLRSYLAHSVSAYKIPPNITNDIIFSSREENLKQENYIYMFLILSIVIIISLLLFNELVLICSNKTKYIFKSPFDKLKAKYRIWKENKYLVLPYFVPVKKVKVSPFISYNVNMILPDNLNLDNLERGSNKRNRIITKFQIQGHGYHKMSTSEAI